MVNIDVVQQHEEKQYRYEHKEWQRPTMETNSACLG